jgi:hypothetical protein
MLVVVSAAAALTLAVAAPAAQGMAMYNGSTYYEGGTSVNFDCGFLCGWFSHSMPYHQQVAYPDKGGSFELTQDGCIMSSGHPNIEDHGYAELTGAVLNGDGDDVEWSMWGNSGNAIGGSPFDVVCSPEPSRLVSSAPRVNEMTRVAREFRAWDEDGDGSLSVAELRAGVTREFRGMDLDHDGVVDARDVGLDLKGHPAGHRHLGKVSFPFDLDGNGKVGANEYWRYIRRAFVRPMSHGAPGPLSLREAKSFYASR